MKTQKVDLILMLLGTVLLCKVADNLPEGSLETVFVELKVSVVGTTLTIVWVSIPHVGMTPQP